MPDGAEGKDKDQLNVPISSELKILAMKLSKRRNKSLAAIIREFLEKEVNLEFTKEERKELVAMQQREDKILSPKERTSR